jgi:hypothetical protein
MMGQPELPPLPQQAPAIGTVLSRLESNGEVGGGSQVVNVVRR